MNPAQIRTIPGAHLDAFCALIKKAEALVDHLEGVEFHSLYTALPLVTQLLGLENPLFGSGKSPYSVISILPKIKDRSVVKWELELSLGGRRQLIDEIYEMIAPILLDEEEAYMDLMVEVVHEDEFRDDPAMKDDFRQLLQRKLAALAPLARRLRLDVPGNFAHIAHYDGKGDLRSEHGHLKHLSEEQFEKWTRSSFPTVVEVNFRGFRLLFP